MRIVNGTGALALTAGLLAFPAAAPLALPAAASLALPGSVAAQEQQEEEVATVTVEGEVLDLVTGIPVAVAIIGIPGVERTAISDEWGYFRLQEIPVGTYVVQVMRIGYETLVAEAPLNGEELLTVYLTPGPVSLEGIEIKVTDEDDLEWRASSALGQSVIGPLEMERLRERHVSLSDVLRVRHLPGSTYVPPSRPGAKGCLRLTQESLSLLTTQANPCSAVVVDGVLLTDEGAGWIYDMSPEAIFAMRFLRGPDAALRYGTAAGNGVLVIETRVGR